MKNSPVITRPRTKEMLTMLNEVEYLFSKEEMVNWFSEVYVFHQFKDIYEEIQDKNPWILLNYTQFKLAIYKIPKMSVLIKELDPIRLDELEDMLFCGKIWNEVARKVKVYDDGTADILPGELRLAQAREKSIQWLLEKRKYNQEQKQEYVPKLGVVVIPQKEMLSKIEQDG